MMASATWGAQRTAGALLIDGENMLKPGKNVIKSHTLLWWMPNVAHAAEKTTAAASLSRHRLSNFHSFRLSWRRCCVIVYWMQPNASHSLVGFSKETKNTKKKYRMWENPVTFLSATGLGWMLATSTHPQCCVHANPPWPDVDVDAETDRY